MNYLSFLAALDPWVNTNPDIEAAAIVGSYVRAFRPTEPDIDIALVSRNPEAYANTEQWLPALLEAPVQIDCQRFGEIISIRCKLGELVAELNFSSRQWAQVPVRPDVAEVVRAGLTPLVDSHATLAQLERAVADQQIITIRNGEISDAPALADIFYRAVHAISDDLYTSEQKQAWAPEPDKNTKHRWQQRIVDQKPFVALLGEQPAGFSSLEPNGHIDLLYVDPELQRLGIADELYQQMLNEAKAFGLSTLTVDASDAATAFFEARGFNTVQRQSVERDGVRLENNRMQNTLKEPENHG